jgi:hypothetical protein
MPDTGAYLYLIWDYRSPVAAELCYSSSSVSASCCDCVCTCGTYKVTNTNSFVVSVNYTICGGAGTSVNIRPNGIRYLASDTEPVLSASNTGSPTLLVEFDSCGESDTVIGSGCNTFTSINGPVAEIRIGSAEDMIGGVIIFSVAYNQPFNILNPITYTAADYTFSSGYYRPAAQLGLTYNFCMSALTVEFTIDCSLTTQASGIPSSVINNLFLEDSDGIPIPATVDASTNQVLVTFELGARQNKTIKWKAGSYITLSFFDI